MLAPVPFNRPALVGTEFEYIRQAIEAMHISGDGAFTKRCHRLFEEILGVPKALLTTSCTHALEMCALLLDLQPGDEVIVPSFTFVSTVNAFLLHGARPVFVDVRPDTLNLDPAHLERAITARTRAVVAVHYAGVACDMDAILPIAKAAGAVLIEDNAHGLFASYRGKPLGTFGALSTLSFHETKNITCGEGGALLVNDPAYVQRAEIIREKGTNRSRFFRGEVDKYTWVDKGSSYLPSDMLAAFLLAQLEARDEIQRKRLAIWEGYREALAGWAPARGVTLPTVPEGCVHPAHMFYVLLPSLEVRQKTMAALKEKGIHSVFHYQPLHLSEMGRTFGGKPGDCPVTEDVSDRLLRLPLHVGLSADDQGRVVEALRAVL